MAEVTRIGVMVLGMHRSGTSALTRVLNLLGCDLPKTLMGAGPTNEAGHWESTAIMRLNDEILSSAGTNWHDWLAFNPGWYASPKAADFKERALAALEEEFEASRFFVLKDPRICRLAPFWLDVLETSGIRPAVILPVRNPLEVADSLAKRDDLDPALGHLLWLRHVLEAEAGTRGHQRFHCSFEGLLSGWPRLISGTQEQLGISWPRLSPLVNEEVDAFLTERLRHHQASPKAVSNNPFLSAWLRDTFAIFQRWSEEGETTADHAALDRIRSELDYAAPSFARLISAGRQSAQKAQALEARLKETQGRLGEAEAAVVSHQQKAQQLECQLEEIRTELSSSEAAAAEMEHRIAEVTELLAVARGELTNAQAEAESLRTELDDSRAQLAHTQSALAQSRAEADETAAKLQETERSLAEELQAERARVAERVDEIAGLTRMLREAQEAEGRLSEAEAARRKEAERADRLAGELETEKRAGENRLSERFREIAVMTRLLDEKENAARLSEEQTEWLREVSAVLMNGSGSEKLKGRLAALLPAPIRLKKQKAQLKRKGIFDPDAYLAAHVDVAEAGIDPLWHYINHGMGEGRQRG